jgi:hypothetical protein
MDASIVLRALIDLNRLEDELRALGPRSTRKKALAARIADERTKVPPFILAHHDRVRARGKTSTVPVKDWICRSCYISVPSGLRTKLASRDDICVCENCGAYIYLPTEQEQSEWDAELARKREAAMKAAAAPPVPVPARKAAKPSPAPKAPPRKKPAKPAKPAKSSKSTAAGKKKTAAPPRKKKR